MITDDNSMVRHDICRHNYAVERGLVVGCCGHPHYYYRPYYPTGWWRGTVVERRSLAGELSLSSARPAADG